MQDLTPYYQIVEECIQELGVDPVGCRGKEPGQWNLRKGSARVWIDLWHIESENRAYYQVMSPVLPIPKENVKAFYEELLLINDKLFGVAFTVHKNWAWLKVVREVEGMDHNEAMAMMVRVGKYADRYDNELADRYGVKLPIPGQSPDEDFPQKPGTPQGAPPRDNGHNGHDGKAE